MIFVHLLFFGSRLHFPAVRDACSGYAEPAYVLSSNASDTASPSLSLRVPWPHGQSRREQHICTIYKTSCSPTLVGLCLGCKRLAE